MNEHCYKLLTVIPKTSRVKADGLIGFDWAEVAERQERQKMRSTEERD